ncbi:MAG: glycosyltransferase family 4 protein [Turicibacter sp.]|nr:glycosyltransferase family 4 protein [Turicibacter sp.]
MKILFMSLSDYKTIYFHGLYSDLLRQFIAHGDEVFVISPVEKHAGEKERVIKETGCTLLKLIIGNMQKTNIIEKGISTLEIERIIIKGIKKYFFNIKFDLILYTTPPITFCRVVEYVKKRDGAKTYLLLKDIFPQNAVDIGIMSKTGIKGIFYRYFRYKEKRLYNISDMIGCMSQANVDYVIKHNPDIDPGKVEVCPNSTEPIDMSCTREEREKIRLKYGIPLNKKVFVYGGNLGKPQGISFIIECLKSQRKNMDVFFLIVGAGTEYGKLEQYVKEYKPSNVKLMKRLPKEDYDRMIGSCDVGLIFLDHRFTIPNFPSRLLSYMQAKLPVLACTDPNTDIGRVIVDAGFGWWCESDDAKMFGNIIVDILNLESFETMKENAFSVLIQKYSACNSYHIIARLL